MLTGRTRYRSTWTGRIVPQVEETYRVAGHRPQPGVDYEARRWRDARLSDVMPVEQVEVRAGQMVADALGGFAFAPPASSSPPPSPPPPKKGD